MAIDAGDAPLVGAVSAVVWHWWVVDDCRRDGDAHAERCDFAAAAHVGGALLGVDAVVDRVVAADHVGHGGGGGAAGEGDVFGGLGAGSWGCGERDDSCKCECVDRFQADSVAFGVSSSRVNHVVILCASSVDSHV